jgi:hypothetical protein
MLDVWGVLRLGFSHCPMILSARILVLGVTLPSPSASATALAEHSIADQVTAVLSLPWLGTIITAFGVIAALVAAFVTYLLTRQRSRLAFCFQGERLLGLASGALPEGITVSYEGEDIPRLMRSTVIIWNAGEKIILRDDVITRDPLRIQIHDGRILSASIGRASREVVEFDIEMRQDSPREANISFAFLDTKDGAVIEVLHTSEQRFVDVVGTIRGLPKGISNFGVIPAESKRAQRSAPLFVRTLIMPLGNPKLVAAISIAFGAASAIGVTAFWKNIDIGSKIIFTAFGLIYVVLGTTMLILSRRRFPKILSVDES